MKLIKRSRRKNHMLVLFLLTTINAFAQQEGSYYIRSQLGTYLDIKEANSSPRATVWTWRQNESKGQKWKLISAGGGYFYIQSFLGTYLDIKESNSGLKATIWTWTLNKGKGQKWKFEKAHGGNEYYIKSALGTYLDIKEANPNPRATVWTWKRNGSKGQKWSLEVIEIKGTKQKNLKISSESYFIKSKIGHRYLDIKKARSSTRAIVWSHYFNGGNGQKWEIIPTGDGDNSYYLKSHLGTYLDIKEANSSPRATIWTWNKNGSPGQKWYFKRAPNKGYYYIQSKLGTYLDIKEASSDIGAQIWTWSNNGSIGQQWKLVKPNETKPKPNPKFTPFKIPGNQFNFTNRFKPNVFEGMQDIKNILGGFSFNGLCGGMSNAANDYFLTKTEMPTTNILPESGSKLFKYIFDRQIESFKNLDKFLEFSFNPDGWRDEEFFYWGLEGRLYKDIKNSIAANKPIPLGLFNIHNDPTSHHQVLAIGYDLGGYREGRHLDPNKEYVRIYVYDPNYNTHMCALVPNPSEKCYDYYEVKKMGDGYELGIKLNKKWRSYFVDKRYRPRKPPVID